MPESLEETLQTLESRAAATQKSAEAVARAAKKLAAAARSGDVAAIDRGIAELERLATTVANEQETTAASWEFPIADYIESGDYERELFQAAEEAGLVLREQDGRIFSYPVLVRILRGGDAGVVTVDKKRTRLLRPSALIAHLRELRERPPKSNSAQFLQALFETYRRATASRPGAVVELIDLYDLMTLFPGLRREYSRQEFARDVYILDRTRTVAVSGYTMELSASTGTRGSRSLRIIDETGTERMYFGVSFRSDARP